jgi:hypothetical protein
MKLDLVSPMVVANYHGFTTRFERGVLTEAKNNGAQET